MRPFTAAEKERFYGRRDEVRQAVDALRRHPFLAVIGPSGSGKSSLLVAGLVPALLSSPNFADRTWTIQVMRPGAQPCTTLAAFVGSAGTDEAAGTRRLLVVDQFEEQFTVGEVSQREPFVQALLEIIKTPNCCVVLACRADFYANLMSSSIWPQVRYHRLEIAPLRGDALREAIAQPAADVGIELEPALVERLLADAGDEPGVLPFIQETLVMLWEHADRLRIRLESYTDLVGDASGRSGLQVALARHADHVYLDVLSDDSQQALTRRMLLRLVQFGEGRADTRRQQTVEELRLGIEAAGSFEAVLATLTAQRLLTLGEEARRVDLAHEALIGGWPRLREWIEERRVAEITRRRLEESAEARARLRKEDANGGLLDVAELAEAEKFAASPDAAELGVSPQVSALVADSRGTIEAAAQEKERTADRLRKRNQGLAIALAAALMAVAVAVVFYLISQREAQNARTAQAMAQANAAEAQHQAALAVAANATAEANAGEAQRQARRAQAENLATKAQSLIQRNGSADDRALILARDAVNMTWRAPEHNFVTNADAALRAAVAGAHWRMTLPAVDARHQGAVSAVAFRPDGKTIASVGEDGTVRLWEAATLKPKDMLVGHTGSVTSVAFSPDGKTLASGSDDNTVRLWDVATGKPLATLEGQTGITSVAFSPDGKTLASATGSDYSSNYNIVRLWDAITGDMLRTIKDRTSITSIAFSPDSKTLATGSGDNTVRLWDVSIDNILAKVEARIQRPAHLLTDAEQIDLGLKR